MRRRRLIWTITIIIGGAIWFITNFPDVATIPAPQATTSYKTSPGGAVATEVLTTLAVKGRAPKTNYARTQFGSGWETSGGCNTRDKILQRDLVDTVLSKGCIVTSGVLHDPYTGKTIDFKRGIDTSSAVQIDHVVALGDAWQTGAQGLTPDVRKTLANDPLELLAVDGPANQQKSDSDAASWLPSNRSFRCQYVARQIAVKAKYELWVTSAEKLAIQNVLSKCLEQTIPAV